MVAMRCILRQEKNNYSAQGWNARLGSILNEKLFKNAHLLCVGNAREKRMTAYYLKKMGIQLWVPKKCANPCIAVYRLCSNGENVGYLFIEDFATHPQHISITRLLQAIVMSVGLQAIQEANGDFSLDWEKSKWLLVFGEVAKQFVLQNFALLHGSIVGNLMMTYHPAELLTSPLKKREVWLQLQSHLGFAPSAP
jgi:hypothetical protein